MKKIRNLISSFIWKHFKHPVVQFLWTIMGHPKITLKWFDEHGLVEVQIFQWNGK
jgi:hypothetical protein